MVTQVTGSYADIYRWDNLYTAYGKAARGKRGQGPAARFEFHLEDNLIQLQEELAGETYPPGPYVSFTIHEPKRRLISAAPFRDRVVHHALCNVIEPAFERSFFWFPRSSVGTEGATLCVTYAVCTTTDFGLREILQRMQKTTDSPRG